MNNSYSSALPIAIATLLSVTVSIAEDKSGILSFKFFVKFTDVFTSDGNISEYFGAKVTSSKAVFFYRNHDLLYTIPFNFKVSI